MIGTRLQLATIWIALMLVYLLGDVLRIFSGDPAHAEHDPHPLTQLLWLGLSVLMVIPILMLLIALVFPHPIRRWGSLVTAIVSLLISLFGLPVYISWHDRFLILVGLCLNLMSLWMAWRSTTP